MLSKALDPFDFAQGDQFHMKLAIFASQLFSVCSRNSSTQRARYFSSWGVIL